MKRVLLYSGRVFIFFTLTIFTQIGGLVYLLSWLAHGFIEKKFNKSIARIALKSSCFLALYLIATFLFVPMLAKPFGRVPLPFKVQHSLKPLTVFTCLLNRNYVRPELREAIFNIAAEMNKKYPGTTTNYLDANFPFVNKFPLLPHLSHNDGKKLDLCFYYIDNKTGKQSNNSPSEIGYGVCEEPKPDEENKPGFCEENGYLQYNFLRKIIPQNQKPHFTFDHTRTKSLVELIADEGAIGKIFIEPHLKTRLGLTNNKIRFHGCQAVRHDDHIHIQIK